MVLHSNLNVKLIEKKKTRYTLTCQHYFLIYSTRLQILRAHILDAQVDFVLNSAVLIWGTQIQNDIDDLDQHRFQSTHTNSKELVSYRSFRKSEYASYCLSMRLKHAPHSTKKKSIILSYEILTGNSSFPFQIPATWRCCMTCLIFNKAGSAAQPALTLFENNVVVSQIFKTSTYYGYTYTHLTKY